MGILSGRYVVGGPRTVTLAVSAVCDSNCLMCEFHSPLLGEEFRTGDGGRGTRFMEPRIFESIVRECAAMGTYRIALCGSGEPALHPNTDEMLRLMNRLGAEPYVITNGLSLDEPRLALWSSLRAHYRFSLHGGDEATWLRVHPNGRPGQFERLTRTLAVLAASRTAKVSALHVLHKANFTGVRQMLEHARQTGLKEVIFRPVQAEGSLSAVVLAPGEEAELRESLRDGLCLARSYGIRTNISDYLRDKLWVESGRMSTAGLYRQMPCYVGWLHADFDLDGTMRPCLDSLRVMGRVGERSIREMWASAEYRAFRLEARAMPRSGKLVRGCQCSRCCLAAFNVNTYHLLHPWRRRNGVA